MNPSLFEIYHDRIKPKSEPVQFIRPAQRLRAFLDEEERITRRMRRWSSPSSVSCWWCPKINISHDISAEKLVHVKRDFGFRNDFLVRLVKKYPNYFWLTGLAEEGGKSFLELVDWKEETVRTGVPVRLNFDVKLPSGFFVRKERREWTRDSGIGQRETTYRLTRMCLVWTKRLGRWRNEPLVCSTSCCLSRCWRESLCLLGKFCDELRFSNAFSSVFTRHSGIFYLSLKGGIERSL